MGYTNTTAHYNLPQYVSSDVPSILGDVNDTYSTIDAAIYAAAEDATDAKNDAASAVSAVSAAQADATQALADAATAQSTANGAVTAAGTAQSTANTAVTNASAAQNTANGAVTLLGNTALPTGQTTVTGAIDALDKAVNRGSVSSVGQSGTTRSQALDALFAEIDYSKLSYKSVLVESKTNETNLYQLMSYESGLYRFNQANASDTSHSITMIHLKQSGSLMYKTETATSGTTTYTDVSNSDSAGRTYILYY